MKKRPKCFIHNRRIGVKRLAKGVWICRGCMETEEGVQIPENFREKIFCRNNHGKNKKEPAAAVVFGEPLCRQCLEDWKKMKRNEFNPGLGGENFKRSVFDCACSFKLGDSGDGRTPSATPKDSSP